MDRALASAYGLITTVTVTLMIQMNSFINLLIIHTVPSTAPLFFPAQTIMQVIAE